MSEQKSEPWAAALGRVPSGLFVLTARRGADETGMLASWVQQCSFDPPRLTVAVRRGRYVLGWLTEGAAFTVNVIPDGNKKLVAHFGKGFDPGEPAFEGVPVERPGDAAPILTDAHAWVACRVAAHLDGGDHVLVVGHVVDGRVQTDGKPATHVRKSGLYY